MDSTTNTTPTELKKKDIANLYSNLQAVIDTPVNNVVNPEAKFIPLPPSLPMSPSSSSPMINPKRSSHLSVSTTLSKNITEEQHKECPCKHIINTNDIATCSLCQLPIPIIEELLQEKEQYKLEIQSLQQELKDEQLKIEQQMQSIAELNEKMTKVTSELDDKTNQFQGLQSDMELLNDKYVDEIERVAEIQHSKDMVESELEDLSRRLFEEANGMVANEKREKYNLEVAQKHLENQLQETRERLAAEQMQLKELRKRMEDMMELENLELQQQAQQQLEQEQDEDAATNEENVIPKTPDHIKDITNLLAERMNLLSNEQKHAEIDALLLNEFQRFIKVANSITLKKIHTIPFMKYCQEEDVEACLRFGPNSRLSARKINEAIVLNTCFIEESPQGFAQEQAKRSIHDTPLKISGAKSMLWERFSSSSSNSESFIFSGCQACGRNDGTALPYRFRISYFDDWACIDRFCRDRLVAVCEFYVLIRNIRQGLYNNRSISDLYHEAMRLRLQMFYARMGALPWTLRTSGINQIKPSSSTSTNSNNSPKVFSSESSPLPKSALNHTHHQQEKGGRPRRGSLDDIHIINDGGEKKEKPAFTASPVELVEQEEAQEQQEKAVTTTTSTD